MSFKPIKHERPMNLVLLMETQDVIPRPSSKQTFGKSYPRKLSKLGSLRSQKQIILEDDFWSCTTEL